MSPKQLLFDFYKKIIENSTNVLFCSYNSFNNRKYKTSKNLHSLETLYFLQNFDHSSLNFFSVSWFMCLIFFFYLTIPLIFYILIPILKAKHYLGTIIIFIIITSIVIRSIYIGLTETTWDIDVKRNPLLRLDSFYIGTFITYLEFFKNKLFKILSKPVIPFVSIISLIIIVWYFYSYIYTSIYIVNSNIFLKPLVLV